MVYCLLKFLFTGICHSSSCGYLEHYGLDKPLLIWRPGTKELTEFSFSFTWLEFSCWHDSIHCIERIQILSFWRLKGFGLEKGGLIYRKFWSKYKFWIKFVPTTFNFVEVGRRRIYQSSARSWSSIRGSLVSFLSFYFFLW